MGVLRMAPHDPWVCQDRKSPWHSDQCLQIQLARTSMKGIARIIPYKWSMKKHKGGLHNKIRFFWGGFLLFWRGLVNRKTLCHFIVWKRS